MGMLIGAEQNEYLDAFAYREKSYSHGIFYEK
jgi:hypothetical protein